MSVLHQLSDELEALAARAGSAVVAVEHPQGHGTGVVLAHDGYLLSNAHVVGSTRRIQVRFSDGSAAGAEVVGSDVHSDLAVLRAERSELTSLSLAAPESIRVGQLVVAMGHPFGLERSVSLGVVSAVERRLTTRGRPALSGLIQTDAAINPGNSGGPLLDVRGDVVGINTAMLPFAQGIGFAVPSSTVSWVAPLLIQHGAVERRYLGIAARNEELARELVAELGQERGVRVLEIGSSTPADSAGVKADDLLLSVNGNRVRSVDDLQRLMALEKASEVELSLWRRGARLQTRVRPESQSRTFR